MARGSRHPFPSREGEPDSLRTTLHRRPCGAYARRALERGDSAVFSSEWLRSHFPRGNEHPALPPDLGAARAWRLVGDDTLEPVR